MQRLIAAATAAGKPGCGSQRARDHERAGPAGRGRTAGQRASSTRSCRPCRSWPRPSRPSATGKRLLSRGRPCLPGALPMRASCGALSSYSRYSITARLQPGERASAAIRQSAHELGFDTDPRLRVRQTGPVPLTDEEFATLADGAALNVTSMLVAVGVLLWIALRSLRLIFAIMLSLSVGLIVTSAFGLFVFGKFNLISIAFAVLFVGLGVDFGIQFCVCYRAKRHARDDLLAALRDAGGRGRRRAGACRRIDRGRLLRLPADRVSRRVGAGRHRRYRNDRCVHCQHQPAPGARRALAPARGARARSAMPRSLRSTASWCGIAARCCWWRESSRRRSLALLAAAAVRFQSAALAQREGRIHGHAARPDARSADDSQYARRADPFGGGRSDAGAAARAATRGRSRPYAGELRAGAAAGEARFDRGRGVVARRRCSIRARCGRRRATRSTVRAMEHTAEGLERAAAAHPGSALAGAPARLARALRALAQGPPAERAGGRARF